jgi:ribosome biogenesis GTPase
LDQLHKLLEGKLSVFSGHSGVGKTSLLKTLLQKEVGRIGDLNETTGRGKHTTTSSVLLEGVDGLRVIDTPGVREFTPTGIQPEDLNSYFPDLAGSGCQIGGCLHGNEPGCKAKDKLRYSSYAKILESLEEESVRREDDRRASKRDRKSPSR